MWETGKIKFFSGKQTNWWKLLFRWISKLDSDPIEKSYGTLKSGRYVIIFPGRSNTTFQWFSMYILFKCQHREKTFFVWKHLIIFLNQIKFSRQNVMCFWNLNSTDCRLFFWSLEISDLLHIKWCCPLWSYSEKYPNWTHVPKKLLVQHWRPLDSLFLKKKILLTTRQSKH